MSKVKDIYSKIAPATKSQINSKNNILEILLGEIKRKLEAQQKYADSCWKEFTGFRDGVEDEFQKLIPRLEKLEKRNLELEKQNKEFFRAQEQLQQICRSSFEIVEKDYELSQRLHELSQKDHSTLEKTCSISEKVCKISEKICDISEKNYQVSQKTSHAADETVWGLVFNNAISDSKWLKNKTFFPGRWAVGYQYLYVLFRVLNEKKPKHILELGLGQSTHMISQYVESFSETKHIVTEHDSNWIIFFQAEHGISERSKILQMDLGKETYLEDDTVTAYQGFGENLTGKKFDFISIDAPFGGEAKVYARIDTLKILPECLEDSFVIMVDDANRIGEQNTIRKIKETLQDYNIEFASGIYKGNKETYIITSIDNKFLCTL